jgi:transposase
MFGLSIPATVYIAVGATDMRKSINGLSLLVEAQFELDLFTGNIFVFCNRRQDIVKMLYWSENGFCLWMKRLEKETFKWPKSELEVLEVNQVALNWLLHGLDLSQAHQRLHYNSTG